MNIKLIAIAILSTSVSLLSGCFTGVESTPKISAKDVKKQNVQETPEMHFLDSINPQAPSEWEHGKKFYILDPRISNLFVSEEATKLSKGDIIEFVEAVPAMTVTGQDATDFKFRVPSGDIRTFRVSSTTEELAKKKQLEIPFTIEMSLVNDISRILTDNSYYVLTSMWYNDDEELVNGRKYIKVKVTGVVPGNIYYPVRVVFSDESSRLGSVFMSVSKEATASRNFPKLFSFNNPHDNYPQITDENWELIKNSRVAAGMTRQECRLALGAPDDVNRRPSSIGLVEIWTYQSGIYLMFTDGILTSFRK